MAPSSGLRRRAGGLIESPTPFTLQDQRRDDPTGRDAGTFICLMNVVAASVSELLLVLHPQRPPASIGQGRRMRRGRRAKLGKTPLGRLSGGANFRRQMAGAGCLICMRRRRVAINRCDVTQVANGGAFGDGVIRFRFFASLFHCRERPPVVSRWNRRGNHPVMGLRLRLQPSITQ